ncbi:hypothetical protein ACN6AX_00950 [Paenibacillus polymyxa]
MALTSARKGRPNYVAANKDKSLHPLGAPVTHSGRSVAVCRLRLNGKSFHAGENGPRPHFHGTRRQQGTS